MLSFLAQKDFESIFSNKLFCKNILNWSKQTDTNAIKITKIRVQTTASSTPPQIEIDNKYSHATLVRYTLFHV